MLHLWLLIKHCIPLLIRSTELKGNLINLPIKFLLLLTEKGEAILVRRNSESCYIQRTEQLWIVVLFKAGQN
jgi:hypothetical protein